MTTFLQDLKKIDDEISPKIIPDPFAQDADQKDKELGKQYVSSRVMQCGATCRLIKETIDVVSEILNKNTETVVLHENIMKEKQLDNNSFPLSLPFNLRIEGNNWLNDFSLTPTSFRDSISQTISYCDSIGWPLPKAGMSINDEKALLLSIS